MALPDAIYSRLSGFAGLSALVSTRITPVHFKQNTTLPAIRYNRISAERPSCMGTDSGILREVYQFDIVSATHATGKAVEVQLILALQRWRTTGIQDTFIRSVNDNYDDDVQQYIIRVEVEIISNG
jgi:hypothetical protein